MPDEALQTVRLGSIGGSFVTWALNQIISNVHVTVSPAALKELAADLGKLAKTFFSSSDASVKSVIEKMIDNAVVMADKAIDSWLANAPLVPAPKPSGTLVFESAAPLSVVDVQAYLDALAADEKADGHAAPHFDARCIGLLNNNTRLVPALKRLPRSQQIRAMGDFNFLSQILDFLVKWGPIALAIAGFFIS